MWRKPSLFNLDGDKSSEYKIENVINSVLDEYGKNSQLYQELKNMEKNGIQYIES